MAKNFTKKDLMNVVEEFFDRGTTTTTLEVKNVLREKGFWAEQRDVSKMMSDLRAEQNWESVMDGDHRVYSRGVAEIGELEMYKWKDEREFKRVAGDLCISLSGKIITQISVPLFKKVYNGKGGAKLDFKGDEALSNLVYYNYLLIRKYQKVVPGKIVKKIIANSYTINGQKLTEKKLNSINSMAAQFTNMFTQGIKTTTTLKPKLPIDKIFEELFGKM